MVNLLRYLFIAISFSYTSITSGTFQEQCLSGAEKDLSARCWVILQKVPYCYAVHTAYQFYYDLAYLVDSQANPFFLQGLESDDKQIRKGALFGFIKLGEKSYLKELRRYLIDVDPRTRYYTARDLAELRDEAGIKYLKKIVQTGGGFKGASIEKMYRRFAMGWLARMGDRDQIAEIKKSFNDNDWDSRAYAFEILKSSDPSVFALFKKDLTNPNESERVFTAEALLEAGDMSGLDVLKQALHSKDKNLRIHAARELFCVAIEDGREIIRPELEKGDYEALIPFARMRCKAAIPYIKELLTSDKPKKQLQALELVSMMNDPSLIKDIEPLLDDQEVKYVAAIVILKLLNPKKEVWGLSNSSMIMSPGGLNRNVPYNSPWGFKTNLVPKSQIKVMGRAGQESD